MFLLFQITAQSAPPNTESYFQKWNVLSDFAEQRLRDAAALLLRMEPWRCAITRSAEWRADGKINLGNNSKGSHVSFVTGHGAYYRKCNGWWQHYSKAALSSGASERIHKSTSLQLSKAINAAGQRRTLSMIGAPGFCSSTPVRLRGSRYGLG